MDYSLNDKNIVYVAGYGNLPANCAIGHLYPWIVLSLIVDVRTDIVVDATVNTISQLSVSFITAQIIGRNILTESEEIIRDLGRYQAPAQKSLIVAFKAAIDRYNNYLKGIRKTENDTVS